MPGLYHDGARRRTQRLRRKQIHRRDAETQRRRRDELQDAKSAKVRKKRGREEARLLLSLPSYLGGLGVLAFTLSGFSLRLCVSAVHQLPSHVERDALRQRQVLRVVDRVGG